MAIETVEDIIEEILDTIGVYGSCHDQCFGQTSCRVCAYSDLNSRLRAAFAIEYKLKHVQLTG